MDQQELNAAIASKPAPKITEAIIKDRIVEAVYANPFPNAPQVTICGLQLANGFVVIGKSAPVSKENFDLEVGKKLAFDDAFKQIWALEGYRLATDLLRGTSADPDAYYANGKNPSNES